MDRIDVIRSFDFRKMVIWSLYLFVTLFFVLGFLRIQPAQSTIVEVVPVKYVLVKEYVFVDRVAEKPDSLECLTDVSCRYLTEAIYHEARGEDLSGQIAIGWVILNRAAYPYYPDTVEEVVTNRCHFSYRCDGSLNRGYREIEAYKMAIAVAEGILNGDYPDPTNGADHYLNPRKVSRTPKWARVYPRVAVIGEHHFHKRG